MVLAGDAPDDHLNPALSGVSAYLNRFRAKYLDLERLIADAAAGYLSEDLHLNDVRDQVIQFAQEAMQVSFIPICLFPCTSAQPTKQPDVVPVAEYSLFQYNTMMIHVAWEKSLCKLLRSAELDSGGDIVIVGCGEGTSSGIK